MDYTFFMKRIVPLFLLLSVCFMYVSCRYTISSQTGSVSLVLPYFTDSSKARAGTTPEGEIYSFEITLTDSAFYSRFLLAESGDEVVFRDIPLGNAAISVKARNSAGWLCYTGGSEFEVKAGENETVVDMDHKNKITLILNSDSENPVTRTLYPAEGLTSEDFAVSESDCPKFTADGTEYSKALAFWEDTSFNKEGKSFWEIKNARVRSQDESGLKMLASNMTDDIELEAVYGVLTNNFVQYLEGPAVSGETIIFADSSTTTTLGGSIADSIKTSKQNMVFDFSECTSLKTVYSNLGDAAWINTIYFPSSMTTIDNMKRVAGNVYISIPANGIEKVAIGSNMFDDTSGSESNWSKYNLHFEGTIADWLGRISYSDAGNPFQKLGRPEKQMYVVNKAGKEIGLFHTDIVIEPYFKDSTGNMSPLKNIHGSAFREARCLSIVIPDTVETIEKNAFAISSVPDIYIGSGVKSIESGAFYIAESSTVERKIYYNGTIDQWMKISCSTANTTSTTSEYGGPLRRAAELYVKENAGSSYVSAVDSDGTLTINLVESDDSSFKEINGQFQGLKSLKKITVNGTLAKKDYFSVADYAFYECENLKEAVFNTTVSFGKKAFSESDKLTDIYLNANYKSICKSGDDSSFNGLTKVDVHVNDNRYGSYAADGNWTPCAKAGQIILTNMSGTESFTPSGE